LSVLQLHPAFLPGYTDVRLERLSPDRGRLSIRECDAFAEVDPFSWFALLDVAPHPALDAMVQAVDPRTRCVATTPDGGARYAWDVVTERHAAPAGERPE